MRQQNGWSQIWACPLKWCSSVDKPCKEFLHAFLGARAQPVWVWPQVSQTIVAKAGNGTAKSIRPTPPTSAPRPPPKTNLRGNGSGNGAAKIPQPATRDSETGGGPNDNLLAIAMAERERLMRSGSARKPAAKATNGWARPTGGGGDAPKAAPKTPQSEGGPNDNLLAIALAERAKAGSSPRRSATPSRRSASPPRARASPKVGPFGMELACVERVLGGGCHLQVICGL